MNEIINGRKLQFYCNSNNRFNCMPVLILSSSHYFSKMGLLIPWYVVVTCCCCCCHVVVSPVLSSLACEQRAVACGDHGASVWILSYLTANTHQPPASTTSTQPLMRSGPLGILHRIYPLQ